MCGTCRTQLECIPVSAETANRFHLTSQLSSVHSACGAEEDFEVVLFAGEDDGY